MQGSSGLSRHDMYAPASRASGLGIRILLLWSLPVSASPMIKHFEREEKKMRSTRLLLILRVQDSSAGKNDRTTCLITAQQEFSGNNKFSGLDFQV
jgi:hypothetical protein